MPYGRAYRTRRSSTTSVARRRSTTRARQKTARSAKVGATRQVASRALRLARRNRQLAHGNWQCNLQNFRNHLSLSDVTPVAFHLTTPANLENVYQFLPDATSPIGYSVQTPTHFEVPSLSQITGGTGFEPWSQYASCNDDAINGKYLLLTSKLTFQLTARETSAYRVRIDFVKPRWNRILRNLVTATTPQSGEIHQLPDSLGSFVNTFGVNMINPMYFKFFRKSVYMRIAPGVDLTTTSVQKTVFIRHNKVLNPIDAEPDLAPYTKISLNNQLWCIVTTDCPGGQDAPLLRVRRFVTWRDMQGHAA